MYSRIFSAVIIVDIINLNC